MSLRSKCIGLLVLMVSLFVISTVFSGNHLYSYSKRKRNMVSDMMMMMIIIIIIIIIIHL